MAGGKGKGTFGSGAKPGIEGTDLQIHLCHSLWCIKRFGSLEDQQS